MKPALLPVRLLGLSRVVVFAACTTPALPQWRRSDGLIDFVLGGERAELPVRVEKVSGGGGSIVSVHARASGTGAVVFGLVGRYFYLNPPPGSHVDVILVDAQGHVVEGIAVEYLPRTIPNGRRPDFSHSRYTASLASKPPPGSTVKIVFHGAPRSECGLPSHP